MHLLTLAAVLTAQVGGDPFIAAPYPQLGSNPRYVELLWQAHTKPSDKWSVQYKVLPKGPLATAYPKVVTIGGIEGSFFRSVLIQVPIGHTVDYSVLREGSTVFRSQVRNRAKAGQPFRVVIVGDVGAGGPEQGRVATQAAKRKPSLFVIPGDIVYPDGTLRDYRARFFPILNSDSAPLLRSTITAPSLGNHDVQGREEVDGLAYFCTFSLPRNGPSIPYWMGLLQYAAGPDHHRMGSYSFTFGDSHWTMLDSNPDLNWTRGELDRWLENTLMAGRTARWRFVVFHHPPFHSSKRHDAQKWMKAVTSQFTRHKVDVVFNGHVHNYQRSRPLTVAGDGTLKIDRRFDGKAHNRPQGTIYVVSGGGGADLYDVQQERQPSTWLPHTVVFKGRHSFLQMDLSPHRAAFRQIADDGTTIDSFDIHKP